MVKWAVAFNTIICTQDFYNHATFCQATCKGGHLECLMLCEEGNLVVEAGDICGAAEVV